MADAAPPPPLRSRRPSPLAAALLGWLVPGLGHLYVGRGTKGLYFFAVIAATYLGGLLLADFRCVSWERDPFWFAAQGVAAQHNLVRGEDQTETLLLAFALEFSEGELIERQQQALFSRYFDSDRASVRIARPTFG